MMLRRPFPGNSTGGTQAPDPRVMAVEKERRKMIEAMARERLAERIRNKRRKPKAGINPPERGGYGERSPRRPGPPEWEGFPKSTPTRLPRYENMPRRDV